MSLLMEALKKAEEAKRLAGEGRAAPTAATADLTLTPLTPSTHRGGIPGSPLPDLSLHIDTVDADLAAISTKPGEPATAAAPAYKPTTEQDDAAERAAARNVFAAKQPIARPRSSLPLIFASGGMAMVALGAYFWWQLQALSTNNLAPSSSLTQLAASGSSGSMVRQMPVPAAAPAATAATEPEPPPLPKSEPAVQPPRTTPPTQTVAVAKQGNAVGERAMPRARTAAPASAPVPAASTLAARQVRISKSVPKSNQTIESAYDALLAGQFDLAQRDYEQVLRRDPKNTDALLGLATIAAQQNQNEQAYRYYLAALETDPTDPTAQAGLVSSGGQSDPGRAESRLKSALGSQPESSALHFALGNVYARQSRWSDAQQAYFRAYSIEPDNADFIFNQAVSLDHLHKNALAAQYYRMALAAADRDGIARPVAFDRQQARNRLLELPPQ